MKDAARQRKRSHTADPEHVIARMDCALELADRAAFREPERQAVARMPVALIGPDNTFRAIEQECRRFFRPVDDGRPRDR